MILIVINRKFKNILICRDDLFPIQEKFFGSGGYVRQDLIDLDFDDGRDLCQNKLTGI